jgi:hypothetical protein
MAYEAFKLLLESGIGVAFLTKGWIPQRHRALLAAHAPLVQGRIGLITLDPRTAAALDSGDKSLQLVKSRVSSLKRRCLPCQRSRWICPRTSLRP